MRTTTAAPAALLGLAAAVLIGPAAAAADDETRPTTVGVTVKTDGMSTSVRATTHEGVLECVKIAAGSGRDRKVWLTLEADDTEKLYVRVRSRATSKCLLTGQTAPKGSRLAIVVEEDVPGPINPRGKAQLKL